MAGGFPLYGISVAHLPASDTAVIMTICLFNGKYHLLRSLYHRAPVCKIPMINGMYTDYDYIVVSLLLLSNTELLLSYTNNGLA